jgi:hypothetical protein
MISLDRVTFLSLVIDLPDSIEQDFGIDLDECDEEQSNDLTDLVKY